MRAVLCTLSSVVLLLAPGVLHARAARKPAKKRYDCATCKDTRRVPCRLHSRQRRKPKPFCSACPESECCAGVRWTPCPKCADDAMKRNADSIQATYAKERRGEGFYPWGKEGFFKAACEHYRFKAAATHGECHKFHAVAEKAFGLFLRIFGEEAVDDIQWDEKGHFLILASSAQFDEFLNWYKEDRRMDPNRVDFLRGLRGVRMIGERLQVLVRQQTMGSKADPTMLLHRIAHGAGHLVIENYIGHRSTPGWWGEGWAGRSEVEALGRPAVYCVQYEAGGGAKRQPHQWRRTVRDAIRAKTLSSWEKLFGLKVGQMSAVEWAMSISIVDWMVTKFPRKTVRLVDAMRDGTASKEAFEEVFGRDLAAIEKAWQKWARAQR